ncbi:MAG: sugar-binding transcriptional regulator, partial [Actinobacteria bacterium]|nr:sugar-binding transcriptional regulator [Actinomycetota bacterium]
MAKSDDLRLMVKTAKLYYLEGLNQEAIAIRFRTSRPTVSRLLAQARESGLVSITIHEPQGQYPDLEGRLEKRFNLTEAIVVESGESEAETLKDIGRGAADFLGRTVRSGDRIGV